MLARDLAMTVAELGERMDYIEYVQWLALYAVEGEEQKRAIKRAQDGIGA